VYLRHSRPNFGPITLQSESPEWIVWTIFVYRLTMTTTLVQDLMLHDKPLVSK